MKAGLRRNRKTYVLIAAMAFGGLGAFGSHYYMDQTINEIRRQDKATMGVVVAREDLAAGSAITADTVSIRQIPMEWMQSGAVRPDDFGSVENSVVKSALGKGEMLMWAMIERPGEMSVSSLVVKGRRAVTLPVDEVSSLSGMLQPGDLVDLVLTVEREGGPRSFPLLEKMKVIATGSRRKALAEGEDGAGGYSSITLDASPEEAGKLIAARDTGRITAMLRNPGDQQPLSGYRPDIRMNTGDVARSPEVAPNHRESLGAGVRIVYGDKL